MHYFLQLMEIFTRLMGRAVFWLTPCLLVLMKEVTPTSMTMRNGL